MVWAKREQVELDASEELDRDHVPKQSGFVPAARAPIADDDPEPTLDTTMTAPWWNSIPSSPPSSGLSPMVADRFALIRELYAIDDVDGALALASEVAAQLEPTPVRPYDDEVRECTTVIEAVDSVKLEALKRPWPEEDDVDIEIDVDFED